MFNVSEELFLEVEFNTDLINRFRNNNNKLNAKFDHFIDMILNQISTFQSNINNSVKSYICYLILNLIKEILSYSSENPKIEVDLNLNISYSSEELFQLSLIGYFNALMKKLAILIFIILHEMKFKRHSI